MFKHGIITLIAAIVVLTNVASSSTFANGRGEPKQSVFTVRVENIAAMDGIVAQDGSKYPFALSPGFFIVSNKKSLIFEPGKAASKQLESQAEDGNPELFYKKFLTRVGSFSTGVFNKPVGKDMASPVLSGNAFEFDVYATAGMKLDLAFMYGQSNDLFYAPERAIDLFDAKGNPISGEMTSLFKLWDAGTEVNQAPGLGPDQAPRQKAPNTGADENGVVHLVNDGFTYPDTKDVLRVTITAK